MPEEIAMRKATVIVAAAMLVGGAAWAADNAGSPGASGNAPGRMQGSPNAAGFGKADTTGTAGPGASSSAPGQEMKQDGRMQGPPNASGFKGEGTGSSSGTSQSR
jgi:hypothetical protein